MTNFSGQGSDVSGMSTTASSWHYSPSHPGIADFSPLLKKYAYQLSCVGEFDVDKFMLKNSAHLFSNYK